MMVTKSQLIHFLLLVSNCVYNVQGRECGTHELTEEDKESGESRLQEYVESVGGLSSIPRQQTIVDTYWHVIHDGSTGRLTRGDIEASMRVLNEDFSNSGSTFQYNLVGTTYTNNRRWFNTDDYGEFFAMSQALRRGDCSTANIYSAGLSGRILGFVYYFPSEVSEGCAGNFVNDGIWIRYDTTPGGGLERYDEGKTLVHEVGHWMGLYHTFEGCFGPGDYVDDTPPESRPNYGCPSSRNTCPGGGPDPINNYMDYSDDACSLEFTRGQVDRMLAQFNAFRANGGGNSFPGFGEGLCYSPHAMATVEHKGKVPMKDLTVGDRVLTAGGHYQLLYTINHFHETKPTNFLQIHTEMVGDERENALEISPMHLVYVEGEEHPVPAIDVQIGDYLQTLDYGPQKVKDIKVVRRNGLYNPITKDGTMLVDGIVTSSYTSFTGSAYLEIAGNKLISVHKLLDLTIAPYRAFCMWSSTRNMCNRHGEGELPVIVQFLSKFYDFWSEQYVPVQVAIICVYLFLFCLLNLFLSIGRILIPLALATTWVLAAEGNASQTKNLVLSQKKGN